MSYGPLVSVTAKINTKALNDTLKELSRKALYVGIAADSQHDMREDGGPNNSQLGYIHEFGSPSANIPPRPFLVPGVESKRDHISSELGLAMKAALNDDKRSCDKILDRLGVSTAEAVKEYLRTAEFTPLKPATIANRFRSRMAEGKRDNEKRLIRDKSGKLVENPNFGVGIRPLINTGSLLNAIDSYLIEG